MWGAYFTGGPVRNFAEAKRADAGLFARWHRAALERGVYLAPSAFEAGFVSSAHTDADIDFTIAQLDAALARRGLASVCTIAAATCARPQHPAAPLTPGVEPELRIGLAVGASSVTLGGDGELFVTDDG